MIKVLFNLGILLNMLAILSCATAEAPMPTSMNRAYLESTAASEAPSNERMITYTASLLLSVRNVE